MAAAANLGDLRVTWVWPGNSLEGNWQPRPYIAATAGTRPTGRGPMSCEHLICAQCAGPVVEGRCPACRASRDHVHHDRSGASPQLIIAAILVLSILLLVAMHIR